MLLLGEGEGERGRGDEGTKWHGEHYALRDSAFFQWSYYILPPQTQREKGWKYYKVSK